MGGAAQLEIGLVADTHGYLGDDVLAAFAACDRIVHAGDAGPGVLDRLTRIAPVTAVRGNTDTGAGREAALPGLATLASSAYRITVVHRLADAPAEGWDILVFGHCHRVHVDRDGGRLLINPGAAGRRGFHTRRSVAVLTLGGQEPLVEVVDLGPRPAARSRP
jgi:hypothetical protein